MELQLIRQPKQFASDLISDIPFEEVEQVQEKYFIEANTIPASLDDLRTKHIIPVFVKDNEPLISHIDFVEKAWQAAEQVFPTETVICPSIRVSHPIKGRVPDARNKRANELQEHEKTIYYERMAFVIEIPSISDVIEGNRLTLTLGGVRAYNLENLNAKKGSGEHFKFFIGFRNKVCCNMCVWSDGYNEDVKVNNLEELYLKMHDLFARYNESKHLQAMKEFANYSLTEQQFALLVGKCRIYPHLPKQMQQRISPLLFGDTQLGAICRDYYKDESFCRDTDGNINLWRLYNLFTGANKTSYIDTFLDRSVNAFSFVNDLRAGIQSGGHNWFLS